MAQESLLTDFIISNHLRILRQASQPAHKPICFSFKRVQVDAGTSSAYIS